MSGAAADGYADCGCDKEPPPVPESEPCAQGNEPQHKGDDRQALDHDPGGRRAACSDHPTDPVDNHRQRESGAELWPDRLDGRALDRHEPRRQDNEVREDAGDAVGLIKARR